MNSQSIISPKERNYCRKKCNTLPGFFFPKISGISDGDECDQRMIIGMSLESGNTTYEASTSMTQSLW